MCHSVRSGELVCERIGELSAFLGGVERLVWRPTNPFYGWKDRTDWKAPDLCLCPVDVDATLDSAGLAWRRGDHLNGEDFMEYHVAK